MNEISHLRITYVLTSIAILVFLSWMFRRSPKLDVEHKLVFITGGSQGLGLCLAREFLQRGANVIIVARNESKLNDAVAVLNASKVRSSQTLQSICADVSVGREVERAIEQSGSPDIVVCCAGASHPRLFKDLTHEQIRSGVDTNYMTAVYTSHAALRNMLLHKKQGHIVFVSSVLSFVSLAGYNEYAPSKAAIRNLADGLRQECLLYGVGVTCVCPGTILTPGFEEENKTKPEITRILEGADEGQTPQKIAKKIMQGLQQGRYLIVTETVGVLMRACAWGGSPRGNLFIDVPVSWLFSLIWPIASSVMDGQVLKYKKKVEKST